MPHFSMNLIFSCDVFNISLFVLLAPYRVQLMDLQGRKKEKKKKREEERKKGRKEERKKGRKEERKKGRKIIGRKKKDRKEKERNTLIRRKEILTMQYINKLNCIYKREIKMK